MPRPGWTPEYALERHVERGAPDACWPWRGTISGAGYGLASVGGKQHRAHRLAYQTWVGEIGAESLDHQCHTESVDCPGGKSCLHRRCCNPAHLVPMATIENVMLGLSPAAAGARRATCSKGHEFDSERITPAGNRGRKCSACMREYQRAYRAKNRDTLNAAKRERRRRLHDEGGRSE